MTTPAAILRLLLLPAVTAAVSLAPPAHAASAPPTVVAATPALLEGRLRVGGKPGDWAIVAPHATAIVRGTDGALVDFWPTSSRSTSPQLKGLEAIDGLWLFRPMLQLESGFVELAANEVRKVGNEIETAAATKLPSGIVVRALTTYRLDPRAPLLVITTRLQVISGGRALLLPGDAIRWGNVDYYAERVGRTPVNFQGSARWIGRHGAAGDLLLETLENERMRIDYRMHHHGLAPEIRTRYARRRVLPGETLVVQRRLAYERLPESEPPSRPFGTLAIRARDEQDRPIPFKLSLRGRAPTRDPNFGNDGDEGGAGRFAWSGNGSVRVALAPGRYRALTTSGIERDAWSADVEIVAGGTSSVVASLPRVLATPGSISADLHLHDASSVDADIACTTRAISIAAEGVELAVASAHYTTGDLSAAVQHLTDSGELVAPLRTMRGTEVSTVGHQFGHFNVFPIAGEQQIQYEDTTPAALFAAMRRASPRGIVQVNHPRLHDLGYFDRYALDPTNGRIAARYAGDFQTAFDTLEVFNGLDAWSFPRVRRVIFDWLHLLGRGHRFVATGGSDSHKLFFTDPGLPRNFIRHGKSTSDETDVAVADDVILDAIRGGRVLVTNGPLIEADVAGARPGDTSRGGGSLRPLRIRVNAAPWIDVSDVEVLLGGSGARLRWIAVPASKSVERLDTTLMVPVTKKTFVVVLAKGRRDLPNVHLASVKPLAFTNPIWLEP